MSQERSAERALALVGIAQAARFVDMTANGETFAEVDRSATLSGIFVTAPDDVIAVFPDIPKFRTGWETARAMLQAPQPAIVQPLRYALNLMDLAARLERNRPVVAQLRTEIDRLAAEDAPWTRTAEIAAVYQATISTLEMRIQVTGEPALLQTQRVAEQIRALLLAGIRYAWLWRQLGGRRWHLVLRRSSIRRELGLLDGMFGSNVTQP